MCLGDELSKHITFLEKSSNSLSIEYASSLTVISILKSKASTKVENNEYTIIS